jgi:hypothetical protein
MNTFTKPLGMLPILLCFATASASASDEPCAHAARDMRRSTLLAVRADFFQALARCANLADPQEREACRDEAAEELREGLCLAQAQYGARLELCSDLGGGRYDPDIDPADFTTAITNPWLPYLPGRSWTLRKVEDGEEEIVHVEVTPRTREIMGVECVVVRDTVTVDGELVEDTFDYFAQDQDGNVWYFGEISMNYEDGYLTDVDGSWIAGADGAEAGIVMPASPSIGDVYRQEMLLGEAEDAAEVASLSETVCVPAGSFASCLETLDFTPLEPDVEESKYYALGVGPVLEVEDGVRLELIAYTP